MKLRVVKMFGNPIARRKKKAARKTAKRRAPAKPKGPQCILRAIVSTPNGYGHLYWGGTKWTAGKGKRFSPHPSQGELQKAKRKLPPRWVSMDELPA